MADEKYGIVSKKLTGAAWMGDLNEVRRILRGRVDVHVTNKYGSTALHCAAEKGHVEIINELLRAGANLTMRDAEGNTARDVAQANGHGDIVAVLEAAARARE